MTRNLGGWREPLAGYAAAQRAAGRSAGTIGLHRHSVMRLATESRRRSPWLVQPVDLETFLGSHEWMPETRKSARGAVRGFYRWGHGRGFLEDDPSVGLPSVRVPPAVPRPTPEHLVRRLLAEDGRLGLMTMLAAYAGLRRGEIARVHRRDFEGDRVAGELLVLGKGGKLRAVPVVASRLAAALDDVEGWAFPNGHGTHLSPGHVGRLLSEAMPDGWTAHTLRHRMATQAYAGTRDLLAVGGVLGHSRPETTQRYVRMPDDALRLAVAAASA